MNVTDSTEWLIDTNILVYAENNTEPKHSQAVEVLSKCWEKKKTYAVSLQNLGEFVSVATRKTETHLSLSEAKKIVQRIILFNNWHKLLPTQGTLLRAIDLSSTYRINFWDAMIAAVMIENGINKIISEDNSFKQIPGIIVENPFEKK